MNANIGATTLPALRALSTPTVRALFARVADAVANAAPWDPHDVAMIDRAHALRVAVAVRWSRAGATEAERRAADEADRALLQHRSALMASDAFDTDGDWLWSLVCDGVAVPRGAWWAYPLDLDLEVPTECVEQALRELNPPPMPERAEVLGWERHLLEHGWDRDVWPYHTEVCDYTGRLAYVEERDWWEDCDLRLAEQLGVVDAYGWPTPKHLAWTEADPTTAGDDSWRRWSRRVQEERP